MKLYTKAPTEVLDYQEDWSDWLGTDTIATSTWSFPAGITKESDTNTTTAATVWVSGGTLGTTYRTSNTVTTAGGRTAIRSVGFRIRQK